MKKTIEINVDYLRITNENSYTKRVFTMYFNCERPVILIQEGEQKVSYSMDKYDFECLKEFIL